MKQRRWRNAAYWLASRPTYLLMALSTLDPPTLIHNKNMCPVDMPTGSPDGRNSSTGNPSSKVCPGLCQVVRNQAALHLFYRTENPSDRIFSMRTNKYID